MKTLWKALGSLKLTLFCLALLMVLVVSCTLAQARLGTFGAVDAYIRTFFVWWGPEGSGWRIPIFPGGGATGLTLMLNLIAAQVGRLELSWRKAGLWAVHAGLIMLFAGEFVTGMFQTESHMSLEEGMSRSFSESPREPELALIEEVGARDRVFSIPEGLFTRRAAIEREEWPFSLLVKKVYRNARLESRMPGEKIEWESIATRGAGPGMIVFERPPVSRDDEADQAAAFVEVVDGDRSLGTWLVSLALGQEQSFQYEGRRFRLALRPKRRYLPFALTLDDFKRETYPGTDIPSHFSSRVRLKDPAAGEREVLISMNQPLRYGGKTFYQSGFGQDDRLSILQVVENPGWLIPYLSCAAISLGLLVHFARRFKPAALAILLAASAQARDFDLKSFGEIPVVHQGRLKPLDTVARSSLLALQGKQTLRSDGRRLEPAEWLLEVMAAPEKADAYPVFRLDDPDLLSALRQKDGRKRYVSFNDLKPALDELEVQFQRADAVEPARRDRFQRAAHGLGSRVLLYQRLKGSLAISDQQEFLSLPPPGEDPRGWTSFLEGLMAAYHGGAVHPGLAHYRGMIESWKAGKPEEFNGAVGNYRAWLGASQAQASSWAAREAAFNRLDLFFWSQALYLVGGMLVLLSWLRRSPGLERAALAPAVAAFALHTGGLLARMILEARPPVTNLYSSAVFVGWVAAGLGLGLERRARGGLGTLAAAATGFATLIIAHHLRLGGDTMEMMRAVLDSNFWLATHVVAITVGYGGNFLAAFLAHVFIFSELAGKLDAGKRAELSRQVYGVVCFSLFFSFVGTVLGGIWADQSWGRFWGWDPKENGALLIVLWNAILLHARWGGFVREPGLMAGAVFGGIITSLSWFGVNMLGVGLHSYGFMDKAFAALSSFVAVEAAVMALGRLARREA